MPADDDNLLTRELKGFVSANVLDGKDVDSAAPGRPSRKLRNTSWILETFLAARRPLVFGVAGLVALFLAAAGEPSIPLSLLAVCTAGLLSLFTIE
ncbi:MAG: hypothetical protein AAFX04_09020 [Pseudomonadota bacterium]